MAHGRARAHVPVSRFGPDANSKAAASKVHDYVVDICSKGQHSNLMEFDQLKMAISSGRIPPAKTICRPLVRPCPSKISMTSKDSCRQIPPSGSTTRSSLPSRSGLSHRSWDRPGTFKVCKMHAGTGKQGGNHWIMVDPRMGGITLASKGFYSRP